MTYINGVIFAAAIAVILCASGSRAQDSSNAESRTEFPPSAQAKVTPAVKPRFEIRSEPAKVTDEGEIALASKGYVKIGTVDAWLPGRKKTPEVIAQLAAIVRRKAADTGGDIVHLDKVAANVARDGPKRVCKKTTAAISMSHVSVEDPQVCALDQNNTRVCVGGGRHSELKPVTTTTCVKWEWTKDATKLKGLLTEGTVWLDLHAKNKDGHSALLTAALTGKKDAAEFLLAHGADANDRDNRGAPALLLAALQGHNDLAELLLGHGADVNAKDNSSHTPLHIASYIGRKDVAEWLLVNKADVDARDNIGATPLHVASYAGRKDVIELLLANKADVNARENDGVTPLHLAKAHGNIEVAELLRQHGGYE